MNIKNKKSKVNKKRKILPVFPSQYVVKPLWIVEDILYNKRSAALQTFIEIVARFTLGMRSECCFLSVRKIAKITKRSTRIIQDAIKEARELKYISEDMISIPEKTSLKDGTKAYRLNLLPPRNWRSPAEPGTFFKAYNLTREIKDVQLTLLEKIKEDQSEIDYLIQKTKSYLEGKITKKDFDDVIYMFENQ